MLTRRTANPAVSTARARRNPTVRGFRDRIRPGSGLLTHPPCPMSRFRCGEYPAKLRQSVRPWQVADCGWMSIKWRLLRLPREGALRVLAGQPVLRTVSVAVRAIRRPGASAHGHMAASGGAADVILQHLLRSEAM